MIPPSADWSTRSASPSARELEPSLRDQLLSPNISATTRSMPSPPILSCFQGDDALAPEKDKEPASSSMGCWGFDLQDPRVGSGPADHLDGGEHFLSEDSDLLKFLSIPTCLQSSSSEFLHYDASNLPPKTENFDNVSSAEDPIVQKTTNKSSKAHITQLGQDLPYEATVQDTSNGELVVGGIQNQKTEKSVRGGRDIFSIVTSAWDGRTVSPKDAFLDYDHVYTKLEDEASRRVSHSWIKDNVITMKTNQPIVNLTENPYSLLDEPSLTADSSPPHLDQRLTIDTNELYSCNSSPGKRVLQLPEESAASQFSLPPQCVPKNAIRWTHYNSTSPSNLETQLLPEPGNSAAATPVEKIHSLDSNMIVKDEMPSSAHGQSIHLNTREVPTSGPSDLLACKSSSVTPNCEEFSASSEDETSTLETEATVLWFDDKSEQPMRHSEQKNHSDQLRHIEASSNNSSSTTEALRLHPDTYHAPRQCETLRRESSMNSTKNDSKRSETPKWHRLSATVDGSVVDNSHMTSSNQTQLDDQDPVKSSDITILGPELRDESADLHEVIEGDEGQLRLVASEDSLDNFTLGDQSSEEIENYKTTATSSLTHVHTVRKTDKSREPSEAVQMNDGNPVKKRRRAESNNYHISSPYPRVTRSSLGLCSSKEAGSPQISTTPVDHPGRGSRKTSRRTTQSGFLIKPSPSPNQTLENVLDDSSGHIHSMGPIMCGHVDERTGEKCETMFKRPYDLARHKETIHDSEGPGGNRKPQWKCGQCGGGFSRKDALIRHCRTRNH
ncbi:hypothetical protein PGT21_036813 [Puccinia graminis f. sp. tritici]|uniref:C2H2-type domain-containing protein n=1 Tax=Puccinia graminis f. sp. tritici TaxID=56615 RepID=A0A5B0PCZ6_PUCGR|nr:hypothetical protein PGTUg99_004255 [Puccinia graminis f. sp. tritici]KAA1098602.1 hypothetical protein PGT21_036813 [Puccinia graminis f. sp. tritici]